MLFRKIQLLLLVLTSIGFFLNWINYPSTYQFVTNGVTNSDFISLYSPNVLELGNMSFIFEGYGNIFFILNLMTLIFLFFLILNKINISKLNQFSPIILLTNISILLYYSISFIFSYYSRLNRYTKIQEEIESTNKLRMEQLDPFLRERFEQIETYNVDISFFEFMKISYVPFLISFFYSIFLVLEIIKLVKKNNIISR